MYSRLYEGLWCFCHPSQLQPLHSENTKNMYKNWKHNNEWESLKYHTAINKQGEREYCNVKKSTITVWIPLIKRWKVFIKKAEIWSGKQKENHLKKWRELKKSAVLPKGGTKKANNHKGLTWNVKWKGSWFTLLCRRMRSSTISSEFLERLNDFCSSASSAGRLPGIRR